MPRANREATITKYFREVGPETAQSMLNVCREIVRERTGTATAPKPAKASKRGRPRKQAQEPAAPATA